MCGVFPGRSGAIVATGATSHHLRVIDGGHCPVCVRCVAGLTHVRACDMRGILGNGIDAVVALRAIVDDPLVVKLCRCPRGLGVAAAALCRGRNVIRRFGHGVRAVMTLHAVSSVGLCVIELRGFPRCYRMTHVALFGGRYVGHAFAGCFESVMARSACADHFHVINACDGIEHSCGMTGGAVVSCDGVAGDFTGCGGAVMAAHARADHLCVVHRDDRRPCAGAVALGAII